MRYPMYLVMVLLTSSCSSPKYTYFFDQPTTAAPKTRSVAATKMSLPPEPVEFTASSTPGIAAASGDVTAATRMPQKEIPKKISEPERAAGELSVQAESRMDPDLKRSAIFAASGLVALIIGGSVFWVLGSLSLLIGLIFGVKWLLRN